MAKKPKIGYEKDKKKKIKTKKKGTADQLFVKPKKHHVPLAEKIIKFFIYIALRIVIKPSKFDKKGKRHEMTDRIYKRIISTDFIFIPSSIAFYIIMAFMPILSVISFLYMIPHFSDWLASFSNGVSGKDALQDILGRFIPGASTLMKHINSFANNSSISAFVAGYVAVAVSLFASTWIAAGGFAKLIFTQSHIYGHKFVGGYFANKFKGIFLVFTFTFLLIIGLSINVAITTFMKSWDMPDIIFNIISHIWLVVSLGIGLFGILLLFFKYSPRFKIKFRDVIPGTMVTTIPTILFMTFFSFISTAWSYGNYGAFGTIMYIGMAALIISYFIFVGIIANAAYYKTFVGLTVEKKWTLSKK